MQYPRHNFAHNFLNAVATDKVAAWDILVNEINEIVLEYPQDVNKAIKDNNLRIHSNPSPKDMVDVIHDGIYSNEGLRKALLKLIAKRHADPNYAADGGPYDKILDSNIDGDLLNDDGELINAAGDGMKKLVETKGTDTEIAADKKESKKLMSDNLAAKESQKGLPVSRTKGTLPKWAKVGIAVAVVGLVSWGIYAAYKANKTTAS